VQAARYGALQSRARLTARQATDLLQQPKYFYFPELPQAQFYERQAFSSAESLEQKTDAIRAELGAILATGAGFEPYVQPETDRPNFDPRGLLNNSDWSACYLIRSGVEERENAARCPNTMAGLREVPLCRMEGRTASVLFSLLRPGAHIPPHHGLYPVQFSSPLRPTTRAASSLSIRELKSALSRVRQARRCFTSRLMCIKWRRSLRESVWS
jgi:hypothetical protein